MSAPLTTPCTQEADITDPGTLAVIAAILHEQRTGVLCTCRMNIPLCSQMAFAVGNDMRSLFVITPRRSTKYSNMQSNPNVSFLVSTARNNPADPETAKALTVTAHATELDGERRLWAAELFSQRHPALADFASSPESAVMELHVSSYMLVSNFQDTTRIRLDAPVQPWQEPSKH